MLLLLVLIVLPVFSSVYLSLFSWGLSDINRDKPFVFLENYRAVLTDPVYWSATGNTLLYVVGSVGVELVLGFGVALLVANLGIGRGLANSIIILPMVMAHIVVGLVWRYMYDPHFGAVGFIYRLLSGRRDQVAWLAQESTALLSVIVVDIWVATPFVVLVLYAGIISLPDDWMDAAEVDGASYLQTVRYIMLPALSPLILLVLLIRTMDSYRVFDFIFALTQGGPQRATETVGYYIYRNGFAHFRMGHATATAVITLVILLAISATLLRMMRRRA